MLRYNARMDAQGIKSRMKTVATWHGLSLAEACRMADLGANLVYNLTNPRVNTVEKFGDATFTDPAWLLFGDEEVPGESPAHEDFEPVRQKIPVDQNTGSNIDLAVQSWERWEGKNFTPFLNEMQRLGLYDKIMFFDHHRRKFVYRYVGGFFLRTLGDYITYAPGRTLGEVDQDKRFASWCEEAYHEALDLKAPLREICDVVSLYTGKPRRFTYDRVLLPGPDSIIIMILQTMEFPEFASPRGRPSNKSSYPSAAIESSAQSDETLAHA